MKNIANWIIDTLGTEIGESGSFDIGDWLQFYVEVDGDEENKFYHIELIHIEESDILETSCCDIEVDKLATELKRILDNNETK